MLSREELIDLINENEEFNKKLDFFTEDQQIRIREEFIIEALEALNEISLGGIKNVANLGLNKVKTAALNGLGKLGDAEIAAREKIGQIKTSIESSIKDVKDAYYTGNIQELEDKLLEIVVQSVNKINEKRKKMGQPPISPKSVLTSISNKAAKMFK
jgi:hypothetical protein